MRRVGSVLGVVAVMALAACTPLPPPAPGYQRPVVDSVVVSPEPARPGDTVTLTLEVSDDEIVSSVALGQLKTPGNRVLPGPSPCAADLTTQELPGRATVTITCDVPTFATNGTWTLDLRIYDRASSSYQYSGLKTLVQFEVVDGLTDASAPKLVEYSTSPAVIDQETVFDLTIRVRDQALPIKFGASSTPSMTFSKVVAPHSVLRCGSAVVSPVSATEVDLAFRCTPGNYNSTGRSEPGLHRGPLPVTDALGNEGYLEMFIDVQHR